MLQTYNVLKLIVLLYQQIKTKKIMKTQKTLKEKVIERLVKLGNNVDDVNDMVEKHFEYASETYPTVKTIAECIRTIY